MATDDTTNNDAQVDNKSMGQNTRPFDQNSVNRTDQQQDGSSDGDYTDDNL